MTKHTLVVLGTVVVCLGVAADINLAQKAQTPAPKAATPAARPAAAPPTMQRAQTARPATPAAAAPALMTLDAQQALAKQYCAGCHSDRNKDNAGGMTLTSFDFAHPEKNALLAEKIIRKVRTGMMPQSGAPRPPAAELKAFAAALESAMDKNAALRPNPGYRSFQRLTRTEYARS